jgi:hypothetical protein
VREVGGGENEKKAHLEDAIRQKLTLQVLRRQVRVETRHLTVCTSALDALSACCACKTARRGRRRTDPYEVVRLLSHLREGEEGTREWCRCERRSEVPERADEEHSRRTSSEIQGWLRPVRCCSPVPLLTTRKDHPRLHLALPCAHCAFRCFPHSSSFSSPPASFSPTTPTGPSFMALGSVSYAQRTSGRRSTTLGLQKRR